MDFAVVVEGLRAVSDGPLGERDEHAVEVLRHLDLPVETLTAQQIRQAAGVGKAAWMSFGERREAFWIAASAFVMGVMSERDTMDRPIPEN